MQKITDSLNTGLSNTPVVKVEPPVGETEPHAEQVKPLTSPSYAQRAMIDDVFRQILVVEGNPPKAYAYMNDMIKQGFYPAPKSDK